MTRKITSYCLFDPHRPGPGPFHPVNPNRWAKDEKNKMTPKTLTGSVFSLDGCDPSHVLRATRSLTAGERDGGESLLRQTGRDGRFLSE